MKIDENEVKLNLNSILEPKIEYALVPGAPISWRANRKNPTPLIAFGTPNNSVKASLSVSKARLNVCRDPKSKKTNNILEKKNINS